MSSTLIPSTTPFAENSGVRLLLADLLREQQDLTAVERFSQFHEHETHARQAMFYRELIPLTQPSDGEQYAFNVDMDACSGCKACVTACHSLNGLEEEETWRDVGLMTGGSLELPVLQHVTTACHHCVEPACLHGCPTRAYEKDSVTGIVRHLDDQCMGCQYCVLMCPYEVPKFSPAKGIVRKCDMCRQRLAADEAPACVQACPNQAITITIVKKADVLARAAANDFLPYTPDAKITKPTTRFITNREASDALRPVDVGREVPAPAHGPLVLMLVLTQMSVGLLFAAFAGFAFGEEQSFLVLKNGWTFAPHHVLAILAAVIGGAGGMAAMLHLGRPLVAVRAWMGWRTSWLSREIVAFGIYGGLSSLFAASLFFDRIPELRKLPTAVLPYLMGASAMVVGIVGIVCSVMIYAATKRPYWSVVNAGIKFGLTAVLFGLASSLYGDGRTGLVVLLILAALGKLVFEGTVLCELRDDGLNPLASTARLLTGPLRFVFFARLALGILGGAWVPAMLLLADSLSLAAVMIVVTSSLFLLAGELAERYLFFTAVVAPRMPGAMP